MRHPSKNPSNRPILITEAPVNYDDEFDRRRKRYLLMMSLRAVCIIAAASTFQLSGWLAAAFVVAALVLPWCAVLLANDRPPRQELRFARHVETDAKLPGTDLQLANRAHPKAPQPPREHTVIDL